MLGLVTVPSPFPLIDAKKTPNQEYFRVTEFYGGGRFKNFHVKKLSFRGSHS